MLAHCMMHGEADISRRAVDVRVLDCRLHPSLAVLAVAQPNVHQKQQHADGPHAQISHDLPPGHRVQKQELQAFRDAHAHVEQDIYAAKCCSCGGGDGHTTQW